MTLGDWISAVITWGTFAAGVYALGSLAWKRWGALVLHILSSYAPPATGTRNAGLAGTYQVEPPSEPPASTAGTRADQAIRVLAALTEDDGTYTYSANKIAEFVGGTRAETLAKIRAARGQPNPAQPPKRTIPHRVNGEERLMEVDW